MGKDRGLRVIKGLIKVIKPFIIPWLKSKFLL